MENLHSTIYTRIRIPCKPCHPRPLNNLQRGTFPVNQILEYDKYIQENQATYCNLFAKTIYLTAVRVPYVIGVRIQNLFKEAQKGRFEVAPLDFSQTFNNIVQNRIFRVSPPHMLQQETYTHEQIQ